MKEYLKGINKKNNLTFSLSLFLSSFLPLSLIFPFTIYRSIYGRRLNERMKRNNHSILFSSSILSLYWILRFAFLIYIKIETQLVSRFRTWQVSNSFGFFLSFFQRRNAHSLEISLCCFSCGGRNIVKVMFIEWMKEKIADFSSKEF